jgi:hypothetical protein
MVKKMTPIGEISWNGELKGSTIITFETGGKLTLDQWATLTNGACFEWLVNQEGIPGAEAELQRREKEVDTLSANGVKE